MYNLPRQKALGEEVLEAFAFGGCRFDEGAGLDRFMAMENLSSRDFPRLCPREERSCLRHFTKANGIFSTDKFFFVEGTKLYCDGEEAGTVEDSKKQFAAMGSYVLIWPDKLCYDTVKKELYPLEASFTSSGRVEFLLAKEDGSPFGDYSVSDTAPEAPREGELWLDSSQSPPVLKEYGEEAAAWYSIPSTCIRIGAKGIGQSFKVYDGVEISGCENGDLNGSYGLLGRGEDYVLIRGILDMAFYQDSPLCLKRSIPDMDFIVEHENRLWGCSSENREIYASKLGDPGNWNCFLGISTDSYALSIGSPGPFTGAASYGSSVLFFKEDCILKILGTKPSNYQLLQSRSRGVKAGSHKSLRQLNGLLFYQAADGIFAYGGGSPERVDAELGGRIYKNAAAGVFRDRYYISMEDEAGESHLFVYDSRLGLWHREDGSRIEDFCFFSGSLCFLCEEALWSLQEDAGEGEGPVSWMLETGELCREGHRRPKRLWIRAELKPGSSLRAALSYDGRAFTEIGHVFSGRKRPLEIPIRLRRCDSLRLRLSGQGDMRIHGMKVFFDKEGSDGGFTV